MSAAITCRRSSWPRQERGVPADEAEFCQSKTPLLELDWNQGAPSTTRSGLQQEPIDLKQSRDSMTIKGRWRRRPQALLRTDPLTADRTPARQPTQFLPPISRPVSPSAGPASTCCGIGSCPLAAFITRLDQGVSNAFSFACLVLRDVATALAASTSSTSASIAPVSRDLFQVSVCRSPRRPSRLHCSTVPRKPSGDIVEMVLSAMRAIRPPSCAADTGESARSFAVLVESCGQIDRKPSWRTVWHWPDRRRQRLPEIIRRLQRGRSIVPSHHNPTDQNPHEALALLARQFRQFVRVRAPP